MGGLSELLVRTPPAGPGRDVREGTVEHLGAERPAYLVLKLAKYACANPACARKSFTPL